MKTLNVRYLYNKINITHMENTRFISLSEDITAYAYQRVEMIMCKKGDLTPNDEMAGDIVITACGRGFKYSYRFNPEIAKLISAKNNF